MTGWVQFSFVPGMAVPGMAQPGKDEAGTAVAWPYLGHVPAYYLDYLDVATQQTLSVTPGGSYAMIPVNSRAGLTIPPPDNCWLTGTNHFAPRIAAPRPLTREQAMAAHGHYPGSGCRTCNPVLEEPPMAVRVAGPDFAPQPSMALVRADLERSRITHGHYAPGGCRLCLSGGMQKDDEVVV